MPSEAVFTTMGNSVPHSSQPELPTLASHEENMPPVAAVAAQADAATAATSALTAHGAQRRSERENIGVGPKQFRGELYV